MQPELLLGSPAQPLAFLAPATEEHVRIIDELIPTLAGDIGRRVSLDGGESLVVNLRHVAHDDGDGLAFGEVDFGGFVGFVSGVGAVFENF
jgi:hypothetical protein